MVRSEYRPCRDLVEESEQARAGATLVATFGLAGVSGYVAHKGPPLRFRTGRATLAAFTSCTGERHVPAGTAARHFRLVMSAPAVERYLGDESANKLVGRNGVTLLSEQPIAPWCRTLILPLLSLESMSPVDRHIAALTLAAEVLRPLSTGAVSVTPDVNCADIEKLNRARDLMHMHADRRLTIPYLSMSVGLNEHAFKHGFRSHFGITPARYLLQLRMRKAWVLLASGTRVAQVAYAVGYEYPANFSAAFTRYFGRNPKSFRAGGVTTIRIAA